MKYVVLGYCYMYTFPISDSHSAFVNWLKSDLKVTSAGFIHEGKCCGSSESLGICSSTEDTDLLNTIMNMKVLGL
jgi:hypothetical protein